jgi:dCMP deaminase
MGVMMKHKHLERFVKQVRLLATNSPCPRAQFGAIIVDEDSTRNLAEGWNGPPKGPAQLCGGELCLREDQCIESGERTETGCHHAEANAILNAAAEGVATKGKSIIVNGAPCLSCAKMIHHADIKRVYMTNYIRNVEGLRYLNENDVAVVSISE